MFFKKRKEEPNNGCPICNGTEGFYVVGTKERIHLKCLVDFILQLIKEYK